MYKHLKPGDEVIVFRHNDKEKLPVERCGRAFFYVKAFGKEYKFSRETGRSGTSVFVRTLKEHQESMQVLRMEEVLYDEGIRVLGASTERLRTIYNALKICLSLPDVEVVDDT